MRIVPPAFSILFLVMKNPTDASNGNNKYFPIIAKIPAILVGKIQVDSIAATTNPGTKYGIDPIFVISSLSLLTLFPIIAHNGTIITRRDTLDNYTAVAISIASGPIVSPAATA